MLTIICRTCDSRKYTYFFPSYLLIPPKPGTSLHKTTLELAAEALGVHDFWKDATAESTVEDDLARKRQWKAPKDVVNNLREFAQKLEGSHNYHNFTVGQDFNDKSSQRFIKKIEVRAIFCPNEQLIEHVFEDCGPSCVR